MPIMKNDRYLINYNIEYWTNKVKDVIEISKSHGYPEQNKEFWEKQPAGVISLILEIAKEKEYKKIGGIRL